MFFDDIKKIKDSQSNLIVSLYYHISGCKFEFEYAL